MSRRRDFEDDGRTIADMSGLDAVGANAARGGSEREGEGHREPGPWEEQPFTWRERFHYMGAALGAALLIAFAFLGGLGLVIWLITLYGLK